jgi:hypothetical protein
MGVEGQRDHADEPKKNMRDGKGTKKKRENNEKKKGKGEGRRDETNHRRSKILVAYDSSVPGLQREKRRRREQ